MRPCSCRWSMTDCISPTAAKTPPPSFSRASVFPTSHLFFTSGLESLDHVISTKRQRGSRWHHPVSTLQPTAKEAPAQKHFLPPRHAPRKCGRISPTTPPREGSSWCLSCGFLKAALSGPEPPRESTSNGIRKREPAHSCKGLSRCRLSRCCRCLVPLFVPACTSCAGSGPCRMFRR